MFCKIPGRHSEFPHKTAIKWHRKKRKKAVSYPLPLLPDCRTVGMCCAQFLNGWAWAGHGRGQHATLIWPMKARTGTDKQRSFQKSSDLWNDPSL